MNLTIANLSDKVTDEQLLVAVAAINTQITKHFQPEWKIAGMVTATRLNLDGGQPDIDASADAIIYLGNLSDDPKTGVPGLAAYHAQNYGKIAYGFVYLDVCEDQGKPWSCALSHEVLETLADPTATCTKPGPDPEHSGSTAQYALEVCDPTQNDMYDIDGVKVSNFVTQAYFTVSANPKTTNYRELPLPPFGVLPEGYIVRNNQMILGMRIVDVQRKAWAKLGEHRRTRRRIASVAPDEITKLLSKGEISTEHRSNHRAAKLLPSLKSALGIAPFDVPSALDASLLAFITEAILGAAWYQDRYGGTKHRIVGYIILNIAVVVSLPIAMIMLPSIPHFFKLPPDTIPTGSALVSQLTGLLTGILALQKTLSGWYASQQRYAAWYKSASDLKTVYYDLLQAWAGKTDQPAFVPALQAATAAARTVIDAEQLDFYQKLALPSFDVLDMLTGTRTVVSSFVGNLLPGTLPTTIATVGKNAVPATPSQGSLTTGGS